jgi:TatD DNase family protein
VHPQVVPILADDEAAGIDRLEALLAESGAIAVGECGLDRATGAHDQQERLFRRQIAVARAARLPLLCHVLGAHDRALAILAEERTAGGVLHSYSGSPELVPRYRDLGFAFSFAGPITFPGARRPVAAARAIPEELLLAETDAPDQTPAPHRGTRCEPAYLPLIVAALAAARGVETEAMAAILAANAARRLGL